MAKSFRLKYVHADIDRHQNTRYYFFKRGMPAKLRLPGAFGSAEFMTAYGLALAGQPLPAKSPKADAPKLIGRRNSGSLEWLCNQYYRTPEFTQLEDNTQRAKRYIFANVCAETVGPNGTGARIGDGPFKEMTSKHVRMLRDRKADVPHTANAFVLQLGALFKWAIEAEHATYNPANDVPAIQIATTEGFHTWTEDEVVQFEAFHPVGSQARLALALYLYTGQRISDVVRLGPQCEQPNGDLKFTQRKNRKRAPTVIEIPVLSVLAEIIAASVCGDQTYLINSRGKPWKNANSFGNAFRAWCADAGLPHCSSHGLRKVACCAMAENGATELQMMSVFGWKNPDEARPYLRNARRAKMAGSSIHLLDNHQRKDDANVSHFGNAPTNGGKKLQKIA